MRKGFLYILGVWLVFSCQEIKDCELETSTDYVIARFYRADTSAQIDSIVFFQRIYELDNATYFGADSTDAIGLPLNPQVEIVNYVIDIDTLGFDLTIEYKPHLRIYYDECSPVYSYKLDTAYSSTFDSVAIVSKNLDKYVNTNIEIYL